MASFRAALPGLLEREGGLVDDPRDPGGLTNFGISARAFPELSADEIRNLTPATAGDLYRRRYWKKLRLEAVTDDAIATVLFDCAVNCGTARAAILAQRILGLVDDGVVGPITLAALNRASRDPFVLRYFEARVSFYHWLSRRPESRPFFRGWISRLLRVNDELRARRLVFLDRAEGRSNNAS